MPKGILKRYKAADVFIDLDDMNRRAELIEFLLSSVPAEGFVGSDGIYPRRTLPRRTSLRAAKITNIASNDDSRYGVTMLAAPIKIPNPTEGAAFATTAFPATGAFDTVGDEFTATNMGEVFNPGPGGSHLLEVGHIVLVFVIQEGADRFGIFWQWPTISFPVFCEKDGGVAGDDSNDCSFTYTVKTLDKVQELDTAVSPIRRRLPLTQYKVAETNASGAAEESEGLAYFDKAGTLFLQIVWGELPDPLDCP